MNNRTLIVVLITLFTVLLIPSAYTYDEDMAASYAALFKPVTGAKTGKALHFMPPQVFVEKLKKGQEFTVIDIRTEKEAGLFTMSLPDSKAIPLNKLFKKEHLKSLPKEKPMMIVCKSGARASVAATALRHIGFKNVYILKGGFKALNTYVGAKEMYAPLPVKLGSMN